MARMSVRAFDRVLNGVIDELPDEFRVLLERVPVVVEREPPPAVWDEMEAPEELLGLFMGPPIEEWERADAPPETAMIYLFQNALEDSCATRAELAGQIRITLLHELGHCLGFDEDGLDRIGLG